MSKISINIRSRKSSTEEEIPIVEIGGSLDAHTAAQLEETFKIFLNNHQYKIIIDFSLLEYISSGGVGLFMSIIDEVREHSGDILLVNLRPGVLRVFQILGLHKIFQILYNEEDAVAKLVSSPKEVK
ncbi:MAG: STAS domain-containing protein [Elusimicrobiota bacterium]